LETEQSLNRLQNSMQDMQQEQQKMGEGNKRLTSLLEATESSVEDYSNVIGQRLVRAIQNGTASSRDLEYAFQRIGRQAIGADGDLERLRTSLHRIDEGNSLENVRRDIQRLRDEADQAERSIGKLDIGIENVAGALIAGGGISGSIENSLESASLDTKIDISFDVPEASKEAIKAVTREVASYGVDTESSLEGVRRQWALNKDAADAVNLSIVKQAGVIASSFEGVDFTELIQEGNEVGAALKISNDEAMALINSLLKAGFPPEQLDTLAEYGQQMKDVGFSTAEIQAIFEKGVDTKTWNIDNLNDGVKEARLQMATFGQEVPKSLSTLLKGTDVSTEQMQKWGKAVAGGGKEGSKAMADMANWLNGIEDKTLKNSIASEIFKTKWEDQGGNMLSVFMGLGDAIDKTDENAKDLQGQMDRFEEDPTVKFRESLTKLIGALQPLLGLIATIVGVVANFISSNPVLAATLTAVSVAIGIILGLILAITPVILALSGAAATASMSIGALLAPFLAIGALIVGIIAIIGTLIAVFVNLYKNNEDFRNKVQEIWASIQEIFFIALEYVKNLVQTIMTAVMTFIQETLGKIQAFWAENGEQIMAIVQMAMDNVKAVIEAVMGVIKGVFEVVWPIIVAAVSGAWELIKLAVRNGTDLILGIIQTILKLLQGDWEGAWNSIKETAENIMGNIISFFEGIDLWDTGKQIIQGLIDGIGSMVESVKTAVTKVGENIKATFAGFFDIHSPSRLMRDEIGKNISKGIGEGIESGEGGILGTISKLGEAMYAASPFEESNKENKDKSQLVMNLLTSFIKKSVVVAR